MKCLAPCVDRFSVLTGMPKNSFMERLIEMTQESVPIAQTSLCDACSAEEEEDEAKEIPAANTYCIDCKQKLCEECKKFHKKMKLCKNHRLVPISEQHTDTGITTENVKPISCKVHDDKVLDIYCAECKTVVCAICFIENHEGHKGFHVNKVVDQFCQVLKDNIESVKVYSSEAELKKSELMEAKLNFQQKLVSLECDIALRKDALKNIADKHAKCLLEELCAVKQKWSKGLQVEIDDFDAYLLAVESYCSHCQKIMTCGSASDICHDVCDLSSRAMELKEQGQCLFQREFRPFNTDLCFRKSEFEAFLEQEGGNMIGEIAEQSDPDKSKICLHKENVILKKDIEQQRIAQESLKLTIESLKLKLNREEQTKHALMSEIDQVKVRNNESDEKLKHEQDINRTITTDNAKIKVVLEKVEQANIVLQRENCNIMERLRNEQFTVNTLQATNDQIKLELDREKMTNKTLQATNDQVKLELEREKMTNKTLQATNDQVKLELDREKMTNKMLQATNDQVKLELDREKMTNKTLQATNDQVKLELDREKMTNKTLQATNDQVKLELDREQMTNKTLQATNDQMKLELDREKMTNKTLQAYSDQRKLKVDEKITIFKTLQATNGQTKLELDREKMANKTLQATNDQMKLELDREKMTNETLQSTCKKLQQQFDIRETTNRSLQSNYDKLRMKLETEKKSSETLLQTIEKLKEELEKKKIEKCGEIFKSDAVLVQTFRTKVGEEGKKPISGLTILDQELFVVSRWSSQVDVYDSMKFSFVRDFKLQELLSPSDIVSCNRNKCLYIMDFKDNNLWKEILRVDPNGNLIKVLSSRLDFGRLFITNESNVILTVYQRSKLNEYSPNGSFIRQIHLSQDTSLCHPWHAVRLTNGDFVVSHGDFDDSVHRVCRVDEDGNFKKSFPKFKGSSLGQLRHPCYMNIDRNGFILVADCSNSRVLLLDSNLEFKETLLTKEKHGLRRPERICLDETNGRLFVADNDWHCQSTIWREGRILVFDLATVDK